MDIVELNLILFSSKGNFAAYHADMLCGSWTNVVQTESWVV